MTNPEQFRTARRGLLSAAGAALLATALPWAARAHTAGDAQAVVPVEELNNALLQVMKAGNRVPFAERYRMLDPVVSRVFDLPAVLQHSVGLSWASLPDADKATLREAFRRYTVTSYLANFDSFNGQSFQVAPAVRPLGDGQVVVETRLVRAGESPVEIDYVMQRGPEGWRAVDVLTNGSISRVAVQRSDFRGLLNNGGVPALTASLQHKVSTLSGGILS